MSAEQGKPQQVQSRRFFQFSLRVLLLVFLACAVGVWWWQLPFNEEVILDTQPDPMPHDASFKEERDTYNMLVRRDGGSPPVVTSNTPAIFYRREVRRMRRFHLSKPVQHGITTAYDKSGNKIAETNWDRGVLHGHIKQWYSNGQLSLSGEYFRGELHGKWILWVSVAISTY